MICFPGNAQCGCIYVESRGGPTSVNVGVFSLNIYTSQPLSFIPYLKVNNYTVRYTHHVSGCGAFTKIKSSLALDHLP